MEGRRKGRTRRVILKTVIALTVLAMTAAACTLTAVCVCAGKERAARPSDCIIVLGARVWPSGRMSHSLLYRCESALEAWKAGVAENIIVTGGRGDDEPAAEADVMRAYFLENGVPEENVIAEDRSVNTIENLRNAKHIMEQKGWTDAAVVTNDYHVQRALWIARDEGIAACAVAARSPDRPSTVVISRLRETASWALYALRRIF